MFYYMMLYLCDCIASAQDKVRYPVNPEMRFILEMCDWETMAISRSSQNI